MSRLPSLWWHICDGPRVPFRTVQQQQLLAQREAQQQQQQYRLSLTGSSAMQGAEMPRDVRNV